MNNNNNNSINDVLLLSMIKNRVTEVQGNNPCTEYQEREDSISNSLRLLESVLIDNRVTMNAEDIINTMKSRGYELKLELKDKNLLIFTDNSLLGCIVSYSNPVYYQLFIKQSIRDSLYHSSLLIYDDINDNDSFYKNQSELESKYLPKLDSIEDLDKLLNYRRFHRVDDGSKYYATYADSDKLVRCLVCLADFNRYRFSYKKLDSHRPTDLAINFCISDPETFYRELETIYNSRDYLDIKINSLMSSNRFIRTGEMDADRSVYTNYDYMVECIVYKSDNTYQFVSNRFKSKKHDIFQAPPDNLSSNLNKFLYDRANYLKDNKDSIFATKITNLSESRKKSE